MQKVGPEELWPGGPRYIQEPGLFPLSSDTAWLGDFLRFGGVRRALDMGCGGGALSLRALVEALRVLDVEAETAEPVEDAEDAGNAEPAAEAVLKWSQKR